MKAEKTKKDKKKSILRVCLIHFTLFSAVLCLSFFAAYRLSSSFYQNAMPVIYDIMKYEKAFKSEDYDAVPINKIGNSSLAVFDENDALIYATSEKLKSELEQNDVNFISDIYDEVWFNVYEFDSGGKTGYIVIKSEYDSDSQTVQMIDYCLLDENFKIVSGTLFSGKNQLSLKEFEILSQGTLSGKNNIEKVSFLTDSGKKRTLVFLTPVRDQKFYNKAQTKSTLVWIALFPFFLILIILETRIFVYHFNKIFRPLDEAVRNFESSRKLKINSSDVPKELESFFGDFTELVEILNHEKNKNLESYKEKQRVFANLSHDLRTPLTGVQGYAKAFVDGVVPEDKKIKYMNAIYERVTEAADIMDSVYEYSKLEHPDYQINLQEDDFCEFCKEFLAEKYSDLEFQGYKMEYSIPENTIKLSFDKVLINRLFNNIIHNSVKYNEKGTTVYFILAEKPQEIHITIADNGKGIPDDIRENAFKPFVVGDEARTSGAGTGLGLTIAKSIAELHNGSISFEQHPKPPYSTQINIILEK